MARRYGRSPRGKRLDGPIPHGHWKSTTFVGGLTTRGFVAPYVLDGAINGTIFLAWGELRPGDIVVMDNSPPTKSPAFARRSRRAAPSCATCRHRALPDPPEGCQRS